MLGAVNNTVAASTTSIPGSLGQVEYTKMIPFTRSWSIVCSLAIFRYYWLYLILVNRSLLRLFADSI